MDQTININSALQLPSPEVKALLQGRTIAILPQTFIHVGRQFALCPADTATNPLPVSEYYRAGFLPTAQAAVAEFSTGSSKIQAWAKCELCKILDSTEDLESLSALTIWTPQALNEILSKSSRLFLAFLRVYYLPQVVDISTEGKGQFISLLQNVHASEAKPVLGEQAFKQRRHQLEAMQPSAYSDLEELQSALLQLTTVNSGAEKLEQDIQVLLGWKSSDSYPQIDPSLAWIKDVVRLGHRSKEPDQGKSNYQAGTDFENIVRKSLEFLGFIIDEAYKGGAGGLDLFCSSPYPLVGECKAGQKIPSGTTEELIKLGGMRLGNEKFHNSTKLIIGPGTPTPDVLTAAAEWKVSIINPMSLQRLVELKARYPGSVDLIELKKYLIPGQIDYKISEYVDQALKDIQIRAHIVKAVKKLTEPERKQLEVVEIRTCYNLMFIDSQGVKLTDQATHELLIELSSPLAGYLGRIQAPSLSSDRFYFLRDLPFDSKNPL